MHIQCSKNFFYIFIIAAKKDGHDRCSYNRCTTQQCTIVNISAQRMTSDDSQCPVLLLNNQQLMKPASDSTKLKHEYYINSQYIKTKQQCWIRAVTCYRGLVKQQKVLILTRHRLLCSLVYSGHWSYSSWLKVSIQAAKHGTWKVWHCNTRSAIAVNIYEWVPVH